MSPLPLVVANWKMHKTASEAEHFATRLQPLLRAALEGASAARAPQASADADADAVGERFELAIAPAFPALDRLGQALAGTGIALAAQNLHAEASGAFTGEVSLAMLEDLGCRYALIGHSERRQLFGEDDATVAAKAVRLAESRIAAILCVGESLEEREAQATLSVVTRQLTAVLDATRAVPSQADDGIAARLVVAYEPIWAIGTGRTATPQLAQEVHAAIRAILLERFGVAGQEIRILYGGSVKPSNARELLAQPDIDGALVGGASLDPNDFASIASCCL